MMVPEQYQKDIADELLAKLREYGLAILAMQERTGKCLTTILACEDSLASKVLILTKKKAIEGWENTINNYIHVNSYTVINYESVHKLEDYDFDIIVLDESHEKLAGYPKVSETWKKVRKLTVSKPIIYCTATPHSEGKQLLFNQLRLSDWTPLDYSNYYKFYEEFADRTKDGKFKQVRIGGGEYVIDYTAVQHDKVYAACEHLMILKTRQELGFKHEPEDVIHYVELNKKVKDAYNIIATKKAMEFTSMMDGQDYQIVCDSPMKLRTTLHMLEGGGLKVKKDGKDEYIQLVSDDKIQFILGKFGDNENLVIMYNYIVEGIKLKKYFKKAQILQGDTYAEGVDLSMYKHLVIYSQNHRTSKHTQRRARQAHKDRDEPILVHYLLIKGAVSDKIYRDVSIKKKNHVDKHYERIS